MNYSAPVPSADPASVQLEKLVLGKWQHFWHGFMHSINPDPRVQILALLLAVLLAHWLVMGWFQGRMHSELLPTTMPQTLFMRALQPTIAPAPRRLSARSQPVGFSGAEAFGATPIIAFEPLQPVEIPALLVEEPAPAQSTNPADEWPVNTRLTYRLKGYYRGDLYGSGQVQWQHSQGEYEVRVDLRMALVVTLSMVSRGKLSEAGLVPRHYEELLMGTVRRLTFDGVAVNFHDGNALRQPPLVQDTASQFVELSRRFSTGRLALAVGVEVPLWLARPTQMNLWTYDVVGLDTLELAELGQVPAYHLRPRPVASPRGSITAELWFAPSLQYLPVRIRINLGDDNYVDLLVERIEQG